MSVPPFGVFFVGASYPIFENNFTRVDATHRGVVTSSVKMMCAGPASKAEVMTRHVLDLQVLDVAAAVTPDYASLKEVALFLPQPNLLPPDSALGLFISVANEWQVHANSMHADGLCC